MQEKRYLCECGKEFFTTSQYAAHSRYCRVHAETHERDYDAERAAWRIHLFNIGKEARTKQLRKQIELKEQELTKWLSEKHTCEKCGKVMTEKYGSGRFCSRGCANGRPQSEETKNKIRNSLLKLSDGTDRLSTNHVKAKNNYENNPKYCVVCGAVLPYEKRNNIT